MFTIKTGTYVLTAIGMGKAFRLLMAFLLANDLLRDKDLYFFSDGATNISSNIKKYFSFRPYVHMLDWYHMEKRMTELLSMALRGSKEDRHAIRHRLDGMIWAGNISDAINYLNTIDDANIKNKSKLEDAIAYLERKRPYLCCYALRGLMGYRNSSNHAEKANDIVVANRQKHNGMSWSFNGSHSLVIVTAVHRNRETDGWIINRSLRFTMREAA